MFSAAAGRVVRAPSTLPAPLVCAFARPAAISAAQKPFVRAGHQRRLSSSKASTPPESSNGSRSAPQTPASAEETAVSKATEHEKKTGTTPPVPAPNVPYAPPTNHQEKPEVNISSFFALHRPISLAAAIPPKATTSSFESVFAPRSPYDRKTAVQNISTLSSGIEDLEATMAVHETHAPADEALEMELQHFNGQPYMSLEELVSRFVPFRPPPVPVSEMQAANNKLDVAEAPSQLKRAWIESTDFSGRDTYSAATAPMVELLDPTAENELEQYEMRQPFLDRMYQRQKANNRSRDILQRPDMLAISVKRQRKLKMKKHKYKKLMKRTRLLRRKLDRN